MVPHTGVRRVVYNLFEALAICAFLIMLCSSILQVYFRYVMDMPLQWTEELARLMCVLTTYFGAVVVLLNREHIRVDVIDGFVSGRGRDVLALAIDLLIAWFLVSVAYGCWLLVLATWNTFTASMDWFRTAYIYIAVGISMVVMTFLLIVDMFDRTMRIAGRNRDGDT